MAISDVDFRQVWWHSMAFANIPQTLNGFSPNVLVIRPSEQAGMKQIGGVPPSQLPLPLQLGWNFSFTGPTSISGSTTDYMV